MTTTNTVSTPVIDVTEVLDALEVWINRKPGLEPGNYGFDANGRSAYRSELRNIAQDKKRALKALDEARGITWIPASDWKGNGDSTSEHDARPAILADSFRAFSGRLKWHACDCLACAQCNEEKMVCRKCMQCTRHGSHKAGCKGCTPHLEYTTGQYFPTEYRKAAASVLEAYVAGCLQAQNAAQPRTFTYQTIADVKAANQAIGASWFSRSTMRFFNTKIETGLIGGKRFITSERCDETRPRKYTVREAQPDGSIDTVGEFQGYNFLDDARLAAKILNR